MSAAAKPECRTEAKHEERHRERASEPGHLGEWAPDLADRWCAEWCAAEGEDPAGPLGEAERPDEGRGGKAALWHERGRDRVEARLEEDERAVAHAAEFGGKHERRGEVADPVEETCQRPAARAAGGELAEQDRGSEDPGRPAADRRQRREAEETCGDGPHPRRDAPRPAAAAKWRPERAQIDSGAPARPAIAAARSPLSIQAGMPIPS